VDALDGQPGPRHHLLGWDGADNEERIALLLRALEGVTDRGCRYKAVVIVAFPDGSEIRAEGQCEGVIAREPSGAGGFGYDPVFYLPERGQTMAEIPAGQKNRISHRARALRAIAAELKSRLPSQREAD
jgi:XTP/dITP diphosphohydrolase